MRTLLTTLLVVGVAQAAPVKEIQIKYEPDAAAAGIADELVNAAGTARARRKLAPRYAKPFLHLAARNADGEVVASALAGMARTWSRTGKGARPKVDGDYRKVVLTRLGDRDGRIVSGALKAARLLTAAKEPHAETVARLLDLASKGAANRRTAAINALVNVNGCQVPRASKGDIQGRCIKAMLGALGAKETYLAAAAAKRLTHLAYTKMPQRDAVAAAAKRLAAHADPGLRGLGVLLAAKVASNAEKAEVAKRVRKLISDSNGFVRASATDAAGVLGDKALAHEVVKRLDDAGKADHSIRGFKALDGGKGRVRVKVEDGRVDVAALRALRALSDGKFKYKRPAGKKRDAMRQKAVSDARAWYQKAKATLPKGS